MNGKSDLILQCYAHWQVRFFTFYVSNISALLMALESAVQNARDNRVVPADEAHERIRTMYTWQNVARRTELVSDTLHTF